MNGIIRRRYRFHGRVQGVGFRYTASYAADRAGVTGWVRNEYNGSVTMEIQGTTAQIENVLETIDQGSYIRIHTREEKDIPVDEDERDFSIHESSWW